MRMGKLHKVYHWRDVAICPGEYASSEYNSDLLSKSHHPCETGLNSDNPERKRLWLVFWAPLIECVSHRLKIKFDNPPMVHTSLWNYRSLWSDAQDNIAVTSNFFPKFFSIFYPHFPSPSLCRRFFSSVSATVGYSSYVWRHTVLYCSYKIFWFCFVPERWNRTTFPLDSFRTTGCMGQRNHVSYVHFSVWRNPGRWTRTTQPAKSCTDQQPVFGPPRTIRFAYIHLITSTWTANLSY